MQANKTISVIIVAAGRGERARRKGNADNGPKQYQIIGTKPIVQHTIEKFLEAEFVNNVVCVIHADDALLYKTATHSLKDPRLLPPVTGGATRQASVFAGLKALRDKNTDYVLVHDAVRPFVSLDTIKRTVEGLEHHPAILPALSLFDTIKRTKTDGSSDLPRIETTVDRANLWAAQTPQAFHFDILFEAHSKNAELNFTDDCAVVEAEGNPVHIVQGNPENLKITTAEDIDNANHRLRTMVAMETRVGNGFDVHAFEEGDHVILAGVAIPHNKKLKGHSDADVGLHTLADALYGALAEGDIGSHFPPTDTKWKGASSDQFLVHACERVKARGGKILHLDLTVICEEPKVGPHREDMRKEVARICNLPLSRVAIKATTTERLGFTGRGEGIAAMATTTIEIPQEDD